MATTFKELLLSLKNKTKLNNSNKIVSKEEFVEATDSASPYIENNENIVSSTSKTFSLKSTRIAEEPITLQSLFQQIADEIRLKKGTTNLIKASSFPYEIQTIPTTEEIWNFSVSNIPPDYDGSMGDVVLITDANIENLKNVINIDLNIEKPIDNCLNLIIDENKDNICIANLNGWKYYIKTSGNVAMINGSPLSCRVYIWDINEKAWVVSNPLNIYFETLEFNKFFGINELSFGYFDRFNLSENINTNVVIPTIYEVKENIVLLDFFGSSLANSLTYFNRFNLVEITDNIITKTDS